MIPYAAGIKADGTAAQMMYMSTSSSQSTIAFAIAMNPPKVHSHPAASPTRPVSFTQAGAFQATKNKAMSSNVTTMIPNGSAEKTRLKSFDAKRSMAFRFLS